MIPSVNQHWLAHAFHILESIERIQAQIEENATSIFNPSTIIYDGLLRRLQTLADASRQLPEDIKAQHPHIKWSNIAGFRNILAHNYLGDLDEAILKQIVFEQLPELYGAVLSHVTNWDLIKRQNQS